MTSNHESLPWEPARSMHRFGMYSSHCLSEAELYRAHDPLLVLSEVVQGVNCLAVHGGSHWSFTSTEPRTFSELGLVGSTSPMTCRKEKTRVLVSRNDPIDEQHSRQQSQRCGTVNKLQEIGRTNKVQNLWAAHPYSINRAEQGRARPTSRLCMSADTGKHLFHHFIWRYGLCQSA